MMVCEVCGALQSSSDTDKRMTMHLEGKLHTGYLKIRNKLADLKSKRDSRRRDGRRRSRSRDRQNRMRDNRDEFRRMQQMEEQYANKVMYSSKALGSGANMFSKQHSEVKYTEMALLQNKGYTGEQHKMGITSLGKEWKYYKRILDNDRRLAKNEREKQERIKERAQSGGGGGYGGGF